MADTSYGDIDHRSLTREDDDIGVVTSSQVAAWYHRQILRIPHDTQNPTKRYLDTDQIIELFNGTVSVQEKVDGKMAWEEAGNLLIIYEDMTGKHTVHNHVMTYKDLPVDKKIVLDAVRIGEDFLNKKSMFKVIPASPHNLTYAVLTLKNPNLFHIHQIMRALSHSPSHFGSDCIEGLVVKNYDTQKFGKWINDEFEEAL